MVNLFYLGVGWLRLALLLATVALWVRIQTPLKMGDISKGVANTLQPANLKFSLLYNGM